MRCLQLYSHGLGRIPHDPLEIFVNALISRFVFAICMTLDSHVETRCITDWATWLC